MCKSLPIIVKTVKFSNQLPCLCDETRKTFIASSPQKHMLEMERMERNWISCSWSHSLLLQQWQFIFYFINFFLQLVDIFTLKIDWSDFFSQLKKMFGFIVTGRGWGLVKHYNTSCNSSSSTMLLSYKKKQTNKQDKLVYESTCTSLWKLLKCLIAIRSHSSNSKSLSTSRAKPLGLKSHEIHSVSIYVSQQQIMQRTTRITGSLVCNPWWGHSCFDIWSN